MYNIDLDGAFKATDQSTNHSFCAVIDALRDKPLVEIGLNYNPLNMERVNKLAELLRESNTLKIINLGGCDLDS